MAINLANIFLTIYNVCVYVCVCDKEFGEPQRVVVGWAGVKVRRHILACRVTFFANVVFDICMYCFGICACLLFNFYFDSVQLIHDFQFEIRCY